jgi:hypothetical protein
MGIKEQHDRIERAAGKLWEAADEHKASHDAIGGGDKGFLRQMIINYGPDGVVDMRPIFEKDLEREGAQ